MTFVRRGLLAAEAAAAVTLTHVAVRVLRPARLMRLVGDAGQPAGAPAAAVGDRGPARSVVRAVERVADLLPWQPRCLARAVAARAMLRRRGIPGELHLGVAGTAPLSAHAWLTVGGDVVQGGPVHRFTPLTTLSQPGAGGAGRPADR